MKRLTVLIIAVLCILATLARSQAAVPVVGDCLPDGAYTLTVGRGAGLPRGRVTLADAQIDTLRTMPLVSMEADYTDARWEFEGRDLGLRAWTEIIEVDTDFDAHIDAYLLAGPVNLPDTLGMTVAYEALDWHCRCAWLADAGAVREALYE